MHHKSFRPQTCTQKAQLSDALHRWRRHFNQWEAVWSLPRKESTFDSLKELVEGPRPEAHTTLEIVDLVAPSDVAKIVGVVSKKATPPMQRRIARVLVVCRVTFSCSTHHATMQLTAKTPFAVGCSRGFLHFQSCAELIVRCFFSSSRGDSIGSSVLSMDGRESASLSQRRFSAEFAYLDWRRVLRVERHGGQRPGAAALRVVGTSQRRRGQSRHTIVPSFSFNVAVFLGLSMCSMSITSRMTLQGSVNFLAYPTVFLVLIWTGSRRLTPHLQLVPSSVKINTNEWLNMMEDFSVPSLGAELGPVWVLNMDNALSHKAKKALEWYEATLHEPSWKHFNCQDKQDTHKTRQTTHTHNKTDTLHHPPSIGRVIFHPVSSPDVNRLDTLAWNAIKPETFTVRTCTSLKAEAAQANAAVRFGGAPGIVCRRQKWGL